jgi:hypothetical protein
MAIELDAIAFALFVRVEDDAGAGLLGLGIAVVHECPPVGGSRVAREPIEEDPEQAPPDPGGAGGEPEEEGFEHRLP